MKVIKPTNSTEVLSESGKLQTHNLEISRKISPSKIYLRDIGFRNTLKQAILLNGLLKRSKTKTIKNDYCNQLKYIT